MLLKLSISTCQCTYDATDLYGNFGNPFWRELKPGKTYEKDVNSSKQIPAESNCPVTVRKYYTATTI